MPDEISAPITKPKLNLIGQVFIVYVGFIVLAGAMAILVTLLHGQRVDSGQLTLIIRCFDLIEMVIPGSPIHQLPSDPFDLLGAHLLVSHFYFSYGLYVYLKIKYRKSDLFSKNNLSPFLLAFGIPLTLVGIIFSGMIFLAWPAMLFRTGAYNGLGLILQYVACKNKSRRFLQTSVIFMVIMNIIGLAFCLYGVIHEMMWRFSVL